MMWVDTVGKWTAYRLSRKPQGDGFSKAVCRVKGRGREEGGP